MTSLAGYPALPSFAGESTAVSWEATVVRNAARAVVSKAQRSQALFGAKANAITELRELAVECAEDGWDGSGASAIDLDAVLMAERFVRSLPDRIALPEFAVEPDGAISLDWIYSRNRLFSVSVGRGSRLAYAWLDGADTGHGVARFDGRNISSRILHGIEAIPETEDVAVRAS